MNIYSIYKATNTINGKVYIGYTSQPVSERINQHRKNYNKLNYIFYYAIRKYGWDAFSWKILYQSSNGDYTKNIMECHFIKKYNSYIHLKNSNGYNMSLGGDGNIGYRHHESTIKKIGDSNRGRPCPVWQKEHLRKLNSGKPQPPHRKSTAKTYEVTSPRGESLIITNLTHFCQNNDLNTSAMCQVAKGARLQYKGWKCRLNDDAA